MRLWLVRHGQVQVRAREFYGGTEVPLSEDGMEQARQAAAALAKVDFKAVISSDKYRLCITVFPPFYDLIEGQLRWVKDQVNISDVKSRMQWI